MNRSRALQFLTSARAPFWLPLASVLPFVALAQVRSNSDTVALPIVDAKDINCRRMSTVNGLSQTRVGHPANPNALNTNRIEKILIGRDEGQAYARMLEDAGVAVTTTRHNGMTHGFVLLNAIHDVPGIQAAIQQASEAIRKALKP